MCFEVLSTHTNNDLTTALGGASARCNQAAAEHDSRTVMYKERLYGFSRIYIEIYALHTRSSVENWTEWWCSMYILQMDERALELVHSGSASALLLGRRLHGAHGTTRQTLPRVDRQHQPDAAATQNDALERIASAPTGASALGSVCVHSRPVGTRSTLVLARAPAPIDTRAMQRTSE